MHAIIKQLQNYFFPSFCAYCKIFFQNDEHILCNECLQRIRPVVSRQLAITATKKITVHAVGAYDQPLVSLILAKSSSNRTIAYQLAILAWQQSVLAHLHFDYIVPIPLHWTRYAWRGYNQADEIAQVIASKSGKPCVDLLKRIKRTSFQSHFKGEAREQNVHHAFQCAQTNPSFYRNKHILLVDDVMTSGATLKHAARELYRLKPARISSVVIART